MRRPARTAARAGFVRVVRAAQRRKGRVARVGCEDAQALHGECAKLGEDSDGSEVAADVLAHATPCAGRAVAAPERRCAHGAGGWYVIQVPTGKEAALCEIIERVAGPGELSECFVPSFETQRKVRGAWETVRTVRGSPPSRPRTTAPSP